MVDYIKAAETLVHQNGTSRNIFFSTDDATIIREIENGTYARMNFTFFYTR
jgi:hypothetical protein